MDPDCHKEEKRSASLDLLLSVVEYKTPSGKLKRGFCSNYLANAKPDERVALHLKSSPSFHIESRTDGMIPPTILIGAGSGLAPFRGFWQKLNQESTSRQPSESMWTPMLKYFVSQRKSFFMCEGGSNWIFGGARVAANHWFKNHCRANQCPLIGWRLFSSIPSSSSLVLIAWKAFSADKVPFNGPWHKHHFQL